MLSCEGAEAASILFRSPLKPQPPAPPPSRFPATVPSQNKVSVKKSLSIMKLSILPLLALASVVIAAPVPVAEPEAKPGYGAYGGYGIYAPPKGGYGKYSKYGTYGSYKRAEDKVEKRGYADYGDYPTPPGGVSRPSYRNRDSDVDVILTVRKL